jgi:RPA family protein
VSDTDQSGAGRREVAYRLFAAEYDDADLSYSESDEERAPNYVVTPTGARINRLFVVGVLTEVETVGDDVLRARVVDPTGAFVLYAGQYQPDEQAFLDTVETPAFVAVTGKARTFQPDDSDRVYTSVRPESISEVDAETRDRWTVGTAEQTLHRVREFATALSLEERGDELEGRLVEDGADEGLAAGIALALDHYGTSPGYLAAVREMALDAARLVAGEIDEVDPVSVPTDVDGTDLDALERATPGASGAVEVTDDGDGSPAPGPATTETSVGSAAKEDATGGAVGNSDAASGRSTGTAEPTGGGDSTGTGSETGDAGRTVPDTDTGGTVDPTTGTDGVEATPGGDAEADTAPDDGTAEAGAEADEIGDFDPGEFELDEEEREEIETEYGTEFQSGTEVEEPGEADIETPAPEGGGTDEDVPGSETAMEATATTPDGTPERTDDPVAGDTGTPGEPANGPEPDGEPDLTDRPGQATEASSSVDDDPGDGASVDEPEPAGDPTQTADSSADDDVEATDTDLEDATVEAMVELDDGDGVDRGDVVDAVVERYGSSPADVEEAIQDALMDGRCYEPDDDTLKPI